MEARALLAKGDRYRWNHSLIDKFDEFLESRGVRN